MSDDTRSTRAQALYAAGDPINELLPIHLSNGAVLEFLHPYCSGCDQQLPDAQYRAFKREAGHDRWHIRGVAACDDCAILVAITVEVTAGEDGSSYSLRPINEPDLLLPGRSLHGDAKLN